MSAIDPATRLANALAALSEVIATRKGAAPETSYTAKLFAQGPARIAKKLGEEGVEAALAVLADDPAELTGEAADLLYHLLVALAARDITLDQVAMVLEARAGISGLTEKASRRED